MKTPLDNALEEISKKITFFDKKYETQYGRPDEYVDKVFTKEYSFAFFDCNCTSGWSAWLDYLQTGRSAINFGCLGDKDDDIRKLNELIIGTFEKFQIWEDKQGTCMSYLEEGGWENTSYLAFKVFYRPKDFYTVGELINNLVDNVFLESEIDEGILIAMGKVATFCDEKLNDKEFEQVLDMFFNCDEYEFMDNVLSLCDEKFIEENSLEACMDHEWEHIYKVFNEVFDERTIQQKIAMASKNKNYIFKKKIQPPKEIDEVEMILGGLMKNSILFSISAENIVSYNFSGDYERALYYLNRLILNHKERETYYLRGIYRSRLFKSENYINFIEAINDFTEAIKIDPNWKAAYLERAKAFIELNKKDEALKDLKKMEDLGMSNFEKVEYEKLIKTI